MIARRDLPQEYFDWNRRWQAPYGRFRRSGSEYGRIVNGNRYRARELEQRFAWLAGPFGTQTNNEIRAYEYPWAYFVTDLRPGMKAMELGGGMGGFQFVLAKAGLDVTNVDPGDPDHAWSATPKAMERANRRFRTAVKLIPKFLEDAGLEPGQFDRIFSISALEHIPAPGVYDLAKLMATLLKPGGKLVLTVDLFLDLAPFTTKTENRYGKNLDVRRLVETTGLDLVVGNRAELNGFDEFDTDAILRNLPELLYGWGYPALAQLLVLQRPESPADTGR